MGRKEAESEKKEKNLTLVFTKFCFRGTLCLPPPTPLPQNETVLGVSCEGRTSSIYPRGPTEAGEVSVPTSLSTSSVEEFPPPTVVFGPCRSSRSAPRPSEGGILRIGTDLVSC